MHVGSFACIVVHTLVRYVPTKTYLSVIRATCAQVGMDLYEMGGMESDDEVDLGNEVVLRCLMTAKHDGSNKRLLASDDFFRLSATCRQIDANLQSISAVDVNWRTKDCATFARQFSAVREVCIMAGYSPESMPFFIRINDFLVEPLQNEVHFKTDFTVDFENDKNSDDQVVDLRCGMLEVVIGRAATNKLVCKNDGSVSRTHGSIKQHGNKFWFTNISANIDCWILKQGAQHFTMIGKKKPEHAAYHVALELGDVVILSTSNLSMFVVELDLEHVHRLIRLIQPTHDFFNKSRDPKSHADAIETIKVSRVQRTLEVCQKFDDMVMQQAIARGQCAVHRLQINTQLQLANTHAKKHKLLESRATALLGLAESQWTTYVLSQIRHILNDQCHTNPDEEDVVLHFIGILKHIAIKDKTNVARQFEIYQTMLAFGDELSTAACVIPHYSADPGVQPLTRIEKHAQDTKKSKGHHCEYDSNDTAYHSRKRKKETKKWLCAVAKQIWIRCEQRDFQDHLLWQAAIRAHSVS